MINHLLNKWIKIEIETTSKNEIGSPTESYSELKQTWGGVQFSGGRSVQDTNGENVITDAIFTIRYDARINYKCRIYYNSQYYKITHLELIGRNEGYRIRTIMFTAE